MMVTTPFKDMLSAPVTVHICCANDLGQLCVDLNAVIECCSPPQRLDCHSWRQEVITIRTIQDDSETQQEKFRTNLSSPGGLQLFNFEELNNEKKLNCQADVKFICD